MRKILSTIILSILAFTTLSQALPPVNLCLGQDATVCQGQTVTITNCNPGGGSIGNGLYMNAPTQVNLSDDQYSGSVPIGFTFNFYGNNYTQCVIGSNGLLSFDLTKANGSCAWALGGAGTVPNPGFNDYRNATMGCYQDMNPSLGGTIQYQTIGTAPNRVFAVLYKEIPMFSCGSCTYMSILLFEGTNNVEYHIGNKPPCTSWNGGLAVQATENNLIAGAIGHFTPGRNNSVWSANQDGKRYTPTSATNYTISTIPYVLVTSPGTNLQWQNTLGQTFPYNNGVLNVNIVPPGTTGYFLAGSACGTGIGSVSDTTWLTRVSSSVTATSTPDICSSGLGSVTANPTSGTPPFTYNWPALGPGQTINNVSAGTYTVQMTDLYGCPSSATVVVSDTPANFSGTTTLVSCPGGFNGTATATMTPLIGNVTYLWSDGQTTQTANNLSAGTYTCVITSDIGCVGNITVTVSEIPPMSISNVIITDVTCYSINNGSISLDVSGGTSPYTYFWDNSSSVTNNPTDLPAGSNVLTVTDANGCNISSSYNINQPTPLVIDFVTPPTQICSEDNIQLEVLGSGGSTPYTYTWYENGVQIGTGTIITVDPTNTNTQYCVVLSESCGSPTTDTCSVITFPTDINPLIVPNEIENCDGDFYFTNMSNNLNEVESIYYEFSNGESYLDYDDTLNVSFDTTNQYSANVTITSVYGCVYTSSFNNIVTYNPEPVADFTFSNNPVTFFETSVLLSDRSSTDVIGWSWYSPYSYPTTSNLENTTFTFPEGEIGQYPVTLTVVSEWGCTDTVTYILNVVQDILLYAPTAFTPDGDEHNQNWGVVVSGIDINDFDLYIFNRWGEIIWESHDPSAQWDGTYKGVIVQSGTYVWTVSFGDLLNDARYEFNGTVNILR